MGAISLPALGGLEKALRWGSKLQKPPQPWFLTGSWVECNGINDQLISSMACLCVLTVFIKSSLKRHFAEDRPLLCQRARVKVRGDFPEYHRGVCIHTSVTGAKLTVHEGVELGGFHKGEFICLFTYTLESVGSLLHPGKCVVS